MKIYVYAIYLNTYNEKIFILFRTKRFSVNIRVIKHRSGVKHGVGLVICTGIRFCMLKTSTWARKTYFFESIIRVLFEVVKTTNCYKTFIDK